VKRDYRVKRHYNFCQEEPKNDSSMIGSSDAHIQKDMQSSWKERKGDALALGAEEGRSDLRKATVSRKQALDPWISEWGNPAGVKSSHRILNP
jgi:hypothetical protein